MNLVYPRCCFPPHGWSFLEKVAGAKYKVCQLIFIVYRKCQYFRPCKFFNFEICVDYSNFQVKRNKNPAKMGEAKQEAGGAELEVGGAAGTPTV